jgi:hypothetical protein
MKTNPTEALSSVALVKAEIGGGINNSTKDSDIEEYITDLSQYWLQRCGVYSLSTSYTATENYNGTGTDVLPLRGIAQSITTLTIGTRLIPASTAGNIPGYFLDDNGQFLYLRGYYSFPHGRQNINVVYQGGNDGIPGDIQRAFTRHCALEYKRKDTINMRSQSAMGGNVALLNDVETTPDIEHVIKIHSRLGM